MAAKFDSASLTEVTSSTVVASGGNATTEASVDDLWSCVGTTPSGPELIVKIGKLGPSVIATMCIPPILWLFMLVIFVEEIVFLVRNSTKWKLTVYKVWILSAYPILSAFCLLGIFLPRTKDIIEFSISFYFVIVVKKFFNYIMYLYGGKHGIAEVFKYKTKVNHAPFPCCFVFCCRPSQGFHKHRLHVLQGLVYQVLIIYPIQNFIETLMIAEGLDEVEGLGAQLAFIAVGFCGTVSRMVCLYALVVTNKASRAPLQQFVIRGKFSCIQTIVIFNTVQGFTLRVLDFMGILPCGFPYPEKEIGFVLQSWLFVCEMFLASLLARRSFRKNEDHCKVIPFPPRLPAIITANHAATNGDWESQSTTPGTPTGGRSNAPLSSISSDVERNGIDNRVVIPLDEAGWQTSARI